MEKRLVKSVDRFAAGKYTYVNKQIIGAENKRTASELYPDEEEDKIYRELSNLWDESSGALDFATKADKRGYGAISIKKFLRDKLGEVPKDVKNFLSGGMFSERTSGYKDRGRRDGTGPYKDSYQCRYHDIGKRKQRGESCPFEERSETVKREGLSKTARRIRAYNEDLGSKKLLEKYRPSPVTSTDKINYGEKVCTFPVRLAAEDVIRALKRRAAVTPDDAYKMVVARIDGVTDDWKKELRDFLEVNYGMSIGVK